MTIQPKSKTNEAVDKVRDAHKAMGLAIDRIAELERALEIVKSNLTDWQREVGSVQIIATHENKYQSVSLRTLFSHSVAQIDRVLK